MFKNKHKNKSIKIGIGKMAFLLHNTLVVMHNSPQTLSGSSRSSKVGVMYRANNSTL